MCDVMLHVDDTRFSVRSSFQRKLRREVIWMQIGRDDLRRGGVESGQVASHAAEGTVCGFGLQIAEVLAEKNLITHAQRHSVLQVCTHRQNGSVIPHSKFRTSQRYWQWRITARPPQDHFAIQHHPHD